MKKVHTSELWVMNSTLAYHEDKYRELQCQHRQLGLHGSARKSLACHHCSVNDLILGSKLVSDHNICLYVHLNLSITTMAVISPQK